jgi:palmitoyl-protein thioesterase
MRLSRQLPLLAAAWALCACAAEAAANRTLPVVIWHGMGDSCCNVRSIGGVRDRIKQALPGWLRFSAPPPVQLPPRSVRRLSRRAGTFVYSLATGEGLAGDTESSFFGNVNTQAREHAPQVPSQRARGGLASPDRRPGAVQVENVCQALANMTELRDGYNGVGFSQGAPLAAQRGMPL